MQDAAGEPQGRRQEPASREGPPCREGHGSAEHPGCRDGRSRFTTWVLLITLLGMLLRFVRLDGQSIWIDEGLSIGWIEEIGKRGWGSLLQNIHGPLHALSIYAASRVSMSEWWLRLPSAVAGTLAIPALAHLGRSLWGARVGLTGAALLAVSPFAVYYSQEVRNYAFTILFASITLAAAWSLAQRADLRSAVWFVVAELLGMLSNLNGAFLALGLNAWLLYVLRRNRRGLRTWLGVHAVVALLLVPYALQVNRQVRPERLVGVETPDFGEKGPLRGKTTLHPMALPYAGYAFAAGYSLGPTLEELRSDPAAAARPRHLPAVFLVVFGFGVPFVVGLVRRDSWSGVGVLVVSAAVVAGFTLWLAAVNIKPFNVRYLSVILPAFLLVVARGLWHLPRTWGIAAAAVAAGVSVWSCFNYLFVPRYGRDDTRGVVEYLEEHAGPDDLVLHINLILPMRYYDRLSQRVVHARPGSGTSPEVASTYAREITAGLPTLWYLECRPERPDPRGYLRTALRAQATSSQVQRFVGINLYRFDLR